MKELALKIRVKENLTDPRYVEFMKYWNYTEKEFDRLYKAIAETGGAYNEFSHRAVRFLVDYKDGVLLPERYNSYEPLKYLFDKNDILKPVSMLSFPAGYLLLRKKGRYSALIDNLYYCVSWEGESKKKYKAAIPKCPLPSYMGIFSIYFLKRKLNDIDFCKQVLVDYCAHLGTDQGFIYDSETDDVLYDILDPNVAEKNIKYISGSWYK